MAERPTDDQIIAALYHLAGEAGDLSLCPYHRGTGTCFQLGQCANPDFPEPQCQTRIPEDGWPLDEHPEVRAWMLEEPEGDQR